MKDVIFDKWGFGMYNRLLLVINPVAGKGKIKNRLYEVLHKLEEQGWIVTVHRTVCSGDVTAFVEQYGADFDRIVFCGGDGTLSEGICGAMRSGLTVPLGYIPCGTTNDLAETLKLPKNIVKAAQVVAGGKPMQLDVGCFNGDRFFAYVASFGAFTKVSYETSQSVKNVFGHLAYVLAGIESLGDIQELSVEITADGIDFSGQYIFGAVCNSFSVAGLVKLPEERVTLNDGLFEVMLVKKPHNLAEVVHLVQTITSRSFDSNYLTFFSAKELSMRFETPTAFTLDGEYGGEQREVQIRNNCCALNFVRESAEDQE